MARGATKREVPVNVSERVISICAVMMVFLAVSSGEETAAAESISDDLGRIASIMKQNEDSVRSYQGRVLQTEYHVVERDDGRFSEVYPTPRVIRTTAIDFVHDRTRGEDFFVKMKNHSDLFTFETPVITERRNGEYVEALLQTDQLNPKLGIIPKLDQSQYLGHSPRNFDAATSIYVLSSAYEDGFARISPSLFMKDDYARLLGEETVEGYKCQKYAVLSKSGDSSYITFLWLGSEVNYSIVKQKSLSIDKGNFVPFSEWEKHGDLREALDFLETARPFALMVNSNYVKTKEGVWVPQKTTSYILGQLRENSSPDDDQMKERMLEVTRSDPHTSNLKGCILEAFHVWELDMNLLKLNETIDPAIFEKSIIPPGVPVSNFLTNVHLANIDGNGSVDAKRFWIRAVIGALFVALLSGLSYRILKKHRVNRSCCKAASYPGPGQRNE